MSERWQPEQHYVNRLGWIRASVLGANDGIVSVASMLVGLASAHGTLAHMVFIGLTSLLAGAMAMAAGEYVSVSSQADSQRADLAREQHELVHNEAYERAELAGIYVRRGLEPALAAEVAKQLMSHDALAAHARDELGLSELHGARPLQAAMASAASFAAGGVLPLLVLLVVPAHYQVLSVACASLATLALLGASAARAGGAPVTAGALRVLFWGAIAMALTGTVGAYFGSVV